MVNCGILHDIIGLYRLLRDAIVTSLTAVLETYSLEEILEMNDVTTEDLLEFLVRHKMIILPEVLPVEFDD